ncbi:hypothetical protein Gogos_016627 [Gossypium gossypioides]|uniref:Uncharacterized protein n=1 Tax=Gossypium gossypioides TaxID=34282 RepID=A0A7J9B8A0_GOSGO|nr:hypothetical protein [Gossypium gossypioides]
MEEAKYIDTMKIDELIRCLQTFEKNLEKTKNSKSKVVATPKKKNKKKGVVIIDESPMEKNKGIQCHKCQRYGHSQIDNYVAFTSVAIDSDNCSDIIAESIEDFMDT